jgi:hypothetical protein
VAPLRLAEDHARRVEALEPELRVAAEALGAGVRDQLVKLAPAMTRQPAGEAGDAVLLELDLEREGAPDGLSLAACLAAHRAYVAARGDAGGLSIGCLALARLLVWAQRAALLGPSPRLEWLGPAGRRPEPGGGQLALAARCAVEVGGRTRRAEAAALIAAPPREEPAPEAGEAAEPEQEPPAPEPEG